MDFLIVSIAILVFFLYGISVGWKARERHAVRLAEKMLDELEATAKVEDDKVYITIEKHGDALYVFDKESNQFMAQGNTREELENNLKLRFPGKKFAASQEDLQKVG